jgi:zinc ribbon protein
MAFCNTCGTNLDAGAKFCASCGTPVPGGVQAATPPSGALPASGSSSSGMRIILIVVAVIVGFAIMALAAAGFIAWKVARGTRIRQHGDKVRVESPFGNVEANNNPEEATRRLGVEVYPGAKALSSGAGTVNVGGMKTVAVEFESDDPPQKVAWFYRDRFPHATISESQADHYAIVSTTNRGLTTVSIEPLAGKTRIHIAVVSNKDTSEEESAN